MQNVHFGSTYRKYWSCIEILGVRKNWNWREFTGKIGLDIENGKSHFTLKLSENPFFKVYNSFRRHYGTLFVLPSISMGILSTCSHIPCLFSKGVSTLSFCIVTATAYTEIYLLTLASRYKN